MAEIAHAFATNPHRRTLFSGLTAAIHSLAAASCATVFLDGSYVTGKPIPGDYDACWDTTGVNVNVLDPVFFDFSNKRASQKQKYLGEFFPLDSSDAGTGQPFIDFFQIERFTGAKKGILLIDLTKETFPFIS